MTNWSQRFFVFKRNTLFNYTSKITTIYVTFKKKEKKRKWDIKTYQNENETDMLISAK